MWKVVLNFGTVIGGLAAFVAFARWSSLRFLRARDAAEQALDDELARRQTATGPCDVSTSVGVAVMLEVTALQAGFSSARFAAGILGLTLLVLALQMAAPGEPASIGPEELPIIDPVTIRQVLVLGLLFFAWLACEAAWKAVYLRKYVARVRGLSQSPGRPPSTSFSTSADSSEILPNTPAAGAS
jgi:hypothetical protein